MAKSMKCGAHNEALALGEAWTTVTKSNHNDELGDDSKSAVNNVNVSNVSYVSKVLSENVSVKDDTGKIEAPNEEKNPDKDPKKDPEKFGYSNKQEWSANILRDVMEGVKAGRKQVVHDDYPMTAKWNSFPFGSNEHFAVACALGKGGLTSDVMPVGRSRKFFQTLRNDGLINDDGHASEALKNEIECKKDAHAKRHKVAMEFMDPETNGGLDTETAKTAAFLAMNSPVKECFNCKSNGLTRRGPTMTKCECGIYFG